MEGKEKMSSKKDTQSDHPPQAPPPYKPPPQRSISNIVLIIIIIIIVIVVPVIIVAVLNFMVSGDGADGLLPNVSLTQADIHQTTATVDVAAVDPRGKSLEDFKAVLLKNGTTEDGTISQLSDGALNKALAFEDSDNSGTLNEGDRFTISIVPDTYYELSLYYYDTEKIVSRTFSVS